MKKSEIFDPRADIGLPPRKRVKEKKCYAAPGTRKINTFVGKAYESKMGEKFKEQYNV